MILATHENGTQLSFAAPTRTGRAWVLESLRLHGFSLDTQGQPVADAVTRTFDDRATLTTTITIVRHPYTWLESRYLHEQPPMPFHTFLQIETPKVLATFESYPAMIAWKTEKLATCFSNLISSLGIELKKLPRRRNTREREITPPPHPMWKEQVVLQFERFCDTYEYL